MKSSAMACAIAATLAAGAFSAFAQGRVYDRNASNNPEIYRQTHPEDAGNAQNLQGPRRGYDRNFERGDRRDDGRRDFQRRNYGPDRYYGQERYDYGARGPEWRRGGYIPREYYSRQYYVNDWRGHHLAAPPRGHQWVQVGSDYVLIALATGLITNLILNQ